MAVTPTLIRSNYVGEVVPGYVDVDGVTVIAASVATPMPVAIAGGEVDRELVVTTYVVTTAFTGASVGDTITATQIIDVSGTPTTVTTIWRNQTTATDLGSAPSAANLSLVGSAALTNAQLRAAAVAMSVADGQNATLGITTGAAVITDANGTVQQYLRGLIVQFATYLARFPASLGIKTAANSLSIAPASDAVFSTISANPSTIYTAQQAVTASAVALAAHALVNGLIVKANPANTTPVFVGFDNTLTTTDDGTGKGYKLMPGESWAGGVTNTSAVWIIGTVGSIVYVTGN